MIHFRHDERTPRPGPPRRDDRCGRRPGLCARPRNSPSKSRGPPEEKIGQAIYDTYRPQSVEEIQTALKKIFAPIFEAALKGELKNHLGYPKNGTNPEKSGNSRNGYSMKTVKTSMGDVLIQIPRNRESTFEPQIIKKTSERCHFH